MPTAALLLLPAALGLLVAPHHEWWRDEAYTWLVVRASPTLDSLFANLGYNGHPWPYYILVWALHRIQDSPFGLALLNLALAIGASAFLFASAPVSRLQALLFSLGFYPLYQYGVIVRTYSLFLFVLFAYCHLRARRPASVASRLLLLAALAQIHLMAAEAAGLLLGFEWMTRNRSGRGWTAKESAAAAAVAASLMLAAWEILPRGGVVGDTSLRASLTEILVGFANGYLPGYGIIEGTRWQSLVGLLLWLSSFAILWGRWRAWLLYLVLTGSVAFTCFAFYGGSRWHHGFYFVYLVPAIWIAGGGALAGRKAQILTLFLAVQVVVGIYAMGKDLLYPYSGGEALQSYREEHGLTGLPVVGMYVYREDHGVDRYRFELDKMQPLLLASADATVYDPKAETFVRLAQHYWELNYFPYQDLGAIHAQLATLADRLPAPFLIVLSPASGLAPFELPAPIRMLGEFPGHDYGETYGLYLWPAR